MDRCLSRRYVLPRLTICILVLLLTLRIRFDLQHMRTSSTSVRDGNQRHDVMLLGYLRGGTTFTGEMLGFRQGHFNIFEPLTKLARSKYFKQHHVCNMYNTDCMVSDQVDEALNIIREIYRCEFSKVRGQILMYQVLKSQETNEYGRQVSCDRHDKPCDRQLKFCAGATSRVTKVARISMSLAPNLLDTLPNLKIVHLLRDPRGVIMSRLALGSRMNITATAESLCLAMESNYLEASRLTSSYSGRIYQVYYEDLATNPMETFKKMYDFIGYSFNKDDDATILEKTQAKTLGKSRTFSKNSTVTASKWREKISMEQLHRINAMCSSLYRVLGYPALDTERQLHDTSIPLRY